MHTTNIYKWFDLKKNLMVISSPSKSHVRFALVLVLAVLFQSCGLFLKGSINRKFPPVITQDMKIAGACKNLNALDTTLNYDVSMQLRKQMLDSLVSELLKQNTRSIVFDQKELDSLVIKDASLAFGEQELLANTEQKLYLSHKRLKNVEYEVNAALIPYYSGDTLYLNPYFNSIKIKHIGFKGLGFLTRQKPLYKLLNNILSQHLANLNGTLKTYHVKLKPLPQDNIQVSTLISAGSGVSIETDATITFKGLKPQFSININPDGMRMLGLFNADPVNAFECPSYQAMDLSEKKRVFMVLDKELKNRFESIDKRNFDTPEWEANSQMTVKIRNGFLSSNLNEALSNLNFRFSANKSFAQDIPRAGVYVPRPGLSCPSGWRCVINPGFCAACNVAKHALNVLPSRIKAGTIGGSANGSGSISCNLNNIVFDDTFSSVAIAQDMSFSGKLNYDLTYHGYEGIGFLLSCPYLQFKGNPNFSGSIKNPELVADITKTNLADGCTLSIRPRPIQYQIQLSSSPVEDMFTNIRNHLTCGAGIRALGITFGLGSIVGNAFKLDDLAQIADAALFGKYDSELELHSMDLPIQYTVQTPYGNFPLIPHWGQKSINAGYVAPTATSLVSNK
ncbi:hypothetical protein HUK80_14870 [Flavobacterium sp. MAH-1]|uniref:Uncharacterized protein n=1 Tax=Flavobacterium agri TaxID=2743471 RepID=A0A7Y8Y420_9FLAO|nr:hypothetical protein [Flavobacterium agri]NUY82185.1 hypothetical protein [Flavobacterium agri]NYA72209.1 hypothetical protein [Flavobacterium agri]